MNKAKKEIGVLHTLLIGGTIFNDGQYYEVIEVDSLDEINLPNEVKKNLMITGSSWWDEYGTESYYRIW